MVMQASARVAAPLLRVPARLLGVSLCCAASAVAAVVVAFLGAWSLVLLMYVAGMALVALFPRQAAASLMVAAIIFEPGAVDFTSTLSDAIWQMPPGFESAVPFTTSPWELLVLAAAASAVFRYPSQTKLPLLAWAIPLVLGLGFAYGMYRGGLSNIAYNEARGLILGIAVFVLAARTLPRSYSGLVKLVLVAESVMAVIILIRYYTMARSGNYNVPLEFLFSHEGSVILGIGLILGGFVLLQHTSDIRTRLLLLAYCGLILAAMLVTGRRAATLVLLVGGLSTGMLLFPVRPKLMILSGIVVAVLGTGYLAAYWNQEYGAAAQPARAIRSQISPSGRDDSSDTYRAIEKANVVETIRLNRVFGVGFGRPFIQFQGLPDLTSSWTLQAYTPHQNVLWLWLKMGILGISVWLGVALIALQRCVARMKESKFDVQWSVAAVSFSGLLVFLVYATVDLGFVGPRSFAPAAVLGAIAFSFGRPQSEGAAE